MEILNLASLDSSFHMVGRTEMKAEINVYSMEELSLHIGNGHIFQLGTFN